jgi:hypothetical protein
MASISAFLAGEDKIIAIAGHKLDEFFFGGHPLHDS